MAPHKTELQWTYAPADLFEAPLTHVDPDFRLELDHGEATATLTQPQDPIGDPLQERISAHIEGYLLVRALQVHRQHELRGPKTTQHGSDRRTVSLSFGAAVEISDAVAVDVLEHDAAGKVIRDTKAERIAADSAVIQSVAPKVAKSPLLCGLLTSYSQAISDPANEMTHLYEVRDALAKHHGGEAATRTALGIGSGDWRRIGQLANAEPLEQSRHRGNFVTGLRAATAEELQAARSIVRSWILAFAATV